MNCPVHNLEMELRTKSKLVGVIISHCWCSKCKAVYRVLAYGHETIFEKLSRDKIHGQSWVRFEQKLASSFQH